MLQEIYYIHYLRNLKKLINLAPRLLETQEYEKQTSHQKIQKQTQFLVLKSYAAKV